MPTDAGYRLFVDRLSSVKPMTAAERAAIAQFLEGAVDLDDVVDRTVRLLASLTRQVAVMQYPSLTRSTVRHIEFVADGPDPADGRAHRQHRPGRAARHRDHPRPVDQGRRGHPRLVRAKVNASAVGQRLVDAAASLASLADEFEPGDRDLVRAVVQSLDDALVEEREERVVLAGTANLARVGTDFPLSIGPVLEALEQHVVLLKLLGTARETSDTVSVRIGHENPFAGLQSTSVVSTEYGSGSELVAGLGVLGPTRMDYPTTMASVRAVATYVSRILAQ